MFSGDEDEQDEPENEMGESEAGRTGNRNDEASMAGSSSSSSSEAADPSSDEMDEDDDDDEPEEEQDEQEQEEAESDQDRDEEMRSSSPESEGGEDDGTSVMHGSQTSGQQRSTSAALDGHSYYSNHGAALDQRSLSSSQLSRGLSGALDRSTTLDFHGPQSPSSYRTRVAERRKIVSAPRTLLRPPLIDPLVFIPHGSPVHALAMPPCGSHVFSGGQDGFIRRIGLYDSVTGSTAENLTMKQGGHIPLVEKEGDKTTIFLTGYWENEDDEGAVQPWLRPGHENPHRHPPRWGPKSVGNASKVSPVYSLAVQSEELWGLSGTESGNINLFTIRHDEGQIRHVFKSASLPPGPLTPSSDIQGHKTGSVISSLDLNHDETVAFSGGWDGIVLGWDLNTGQVINKFVAHASQISTVSLRQDTALAIYDSKFEESLAEPEPTPDEPVQLSEKAVEPASVSVSPEKPPMLSSPASSPDKPLAEDDDDDTEDGSLFGGESNSGSDTAPPPVARPALSLPSRRDGTKETVGLQLPTTASKPIPLPPKPVLPPTHLTQVPSVLDSSLPFLNDDLLMTSAIDGQVYLWDRRIEPTSSKGLVRKLDLPKGTSPWTASAAWANDGRAVYVGRRNHAVDIYDLRFVRAKHAAVQRTIRLPPSSGPVSCVKAWPDGNSVLCASFDNVRLWNLKAEADGVKVPFKIIPGNSSGVVSQMCVTPSQRYLVTASGDRGWETTSNEYVVIHEIRAL